MQAQENDGSSKVERLVRFFKTAEHVRREISTWPEWKRKALGDVPRMPKFKPTK